MFPSVDAIQKLNHLGKKSTKRYFHVAIICNAAQKGSNFWVYWRNSKLRQTQK